MAELPMTRRELIKVGLVTGASGALGFALAACTAATPTANAQATTSPAPSSTNADNIKYLNTAIGLEYQAIWAYKTAAGTGKLNGSDNISMQVLNLAKENMADHTAHAAALVAAVQALGGTPVQAQSSYDLSSYVNGGYGNLNDVAGIARLALALEVDAAVAYASTIPSLTGNNLVSAAASILPDESAHAAAIRALLRQAGLTVDHLVPAALLSAQTRDQWVIKM